MTRPVQLTSELTLAALRTAIGIAGLFTEDTLHAWDLDDLVHPQAIPIVTELVTNAVKTTGSFEEKPNLRALTDVRFISVRLVLTDEAVCIEVWDSNQHSLVQQTLGAQAQHSTTSRPQCPLINLGAHLPAAVLSHPLGISAHPA